MSEFDKCEPVGESPMIEHHEEHHDGKQSPSFKVELVRKCSKPLERQILEGVKIDKFKGITMNRKGEWGQNLPPKFSIEGQGETQYNQKSRTIAAKRNAPGKEIGEGRKRVKMCTEVVSDELVVRNESENVSSFYFVIILLCNTPTANKNTNTNANTNRKLFPKVKR